MANPAPDGDGQDVPPPAASEYDPPTNTLRPLSDSLLTVRIIKSFQYRTCKNLVLDHLDFTTVTVGELKERCLTGARFFSTRHP